MGAGDGLFVCQSARENPAKFYIGIDANASRLEKVSEKVTRRPAKGGLPNVIFLQAAIEELPVELGGIANEVHIQFPWGTLLGAVASGDTGVLRGLRRICASDAILLIIIGLDAKRDRSEIERLGIEPLSPDFIENELRPRYHNAGFDIVERGVLSQSEWSNLRSSWAKRLLGNPERSLTYIKARAIDSQK
jgi:16S rRNA (adenine(1408)-N(1))-methyltransferase